MNDQSYIPHATFEECLAHNIGLIKKLSKRTKKFYKQLGENMYWDEAETLVTYAAWKAWTVQVKKAASNNGKSQFSFGAYLQRTIQRVHAEEYQKQCISIERQKINKNWRGGIAYDFEESIINKDFIATQFSKLPATLHPIAKARFIEGKTIKGIMGQFDMSKAVVCEAIRESKARLNEYGSFYI